MNSGKLRNVVYVFVMHVVRIIKIGGRRSSGLYWSKCKEER